MQINQELVEVLNDLILVNNDRIEGYQKAKDEAGEGNVDLKAIFDQMSDESRKYISELSHEIYKLDGEAVTNSTTISGKIYRTWMDLKNSIKGNNRLALLESCEFGEDAAQKAYQQALVSDETLSIDVRQLIAHQKESLKESHDTIKRFRDMHKKSDSDDIVNSNRLRNSDNDLRSEKYLSGIDN